MNIIIITDIMFLSKIALSKWPRCLLAAVFLSTVTGCDASAPETQSPASLFNVVVTSSVLCDLTHQIAGHTIALTCLVKPGVDPHAYVLTSRDRKALEQAQLIFYNGYGLEPNLEKAIQAAPGNITKIAVAEEAVPKPLWAHSHNHHAAAANAEGEEDHQPSDHHHAQEQYKGSTPEDNPVADPHVWHSPKQGAEMVTVLARGLAKLVPEYADTYAQNSNTIVTELTQIDTWIQAQIQTIPEQQRQLFTTHNALAYFANTYGLKLGGALQGFSTEERLSVARIKDLVKKIEMAQAPMIFVESGETPKVMQAVAKETGIPISSLVLFTDALGEANSRGHTYQMMLIANTETIVKGLEGQYTPYVSP